VVTDLIFDFFGTLVDYIPGPFHTSAYEQTHAYLLRHGFDVSYDRFVSAFTEASETVETSRKQTCREYHMDDLGRGFFQNLGNHGIPEPVLKGFVSVFMQEWSRGIIYLDGLDRMLERLSSRFRLSILSNTHYPTLIPDNLAAMGIAHLFAQVITSVEVGICKPNPAIFRHALIRLKIAPHQALYIGDTYVDDYQGAAAENIPCILIEPIGRRANVPHQIPTVFALEQYLDRIGIS
jgi:putative hydrolase of the HAD superfamily